MAASFYEILWGGERKNDQKTIVIYPLYGYLLVPVFIIGFAGILVLQDNPLDNPDNVLPELVVNLANFSPWLIGIMLSGALAAAMSTGANLAHSASTVLVRDLFVAVFKQDMPERRVVLLTRLFVVVISVLSYLLPWDSSRRSCSCCWAPMARWCNSSRS